MNILRCKNYLTGIFILLLTMVVTISCSKDDEPKQEDGKHAKITISVSDQFSKSEGDNFSFHVGATTIESKSIDWKVGGQVEKGTVISLSSDDVDGGRSNILVESAQGFYVGLVNIGGFNIAGESFTITYKIEVGDKIVDEQSVEMNAGDDAFAKNYQL